MLRLVALPLLLLPALAVAQAPPAERGGRPDRAAARAAELDRLFEALRSAPDEAGGLLVEMRIRELWGRQVSPAAALLLRRGLRNLEQNLPDEALEDFDAAITLEPEAAELFLMRARALDALGDGNAAARDIQQALRLEPRHFGALLQLSQLQSEAGDHQGALRSFEAVLALHPMLRGAEERRRELRRRAFGDAL